jgi:hypothetical protein
VGIFLTTAGMVKSLGSPFWLLPVWLTTGVAAAGGAICFGALSARRPEAGGAYVYFTVPTVVFVGLTVAAVFVLGQGARNTARPIGRNQIGRLDRLRNMKRLRALQSCPV